MSFFVTGGTLQSDAPSYVEREADRQLYEGLLEGDFCYVLTARQMGKSSLMVRTANRLRMAGVHVAVLDLTALGGQNITPQQWYFGLLDTLGQEMGLCNELEAFWQANEHLGPLHRFIKSLRHIVLPRLDLTGDSISPQPGVDETTPVVPQAAPVTRIDDETPRSISTKVRLVIFVDEIDFVRSFPFSTDEFFAAIRECYNHRTRDSTYEQVTFCLLGVASPSDLVRDTRTTPFNIGRRIELNDFTPLEATALAQGLEDANPEYRRSKAVLDRILYWTEGHPYLTQRLCRAAAEALGATDFRAGPMAESPSQSVDGLCAGLFFSARARERDDNLIFVRERLVRNDADLSSLLDVYLKIWQGKRVMDDEFDPVINLLRLSGVARVSRGRLRERNRIYARVFDDEWVRCNLPDAELRRQREAYRRGVIRATAATALASIVIIALSLLSVSAVNKRYEANLAQAKAWRSSGLKGQRIEALRAIEQAKHWRIFSRNLPELRNESLAALNLVDLEEDRVIIAPGPAVTVPELNGTFSRYAVADRNGGIRISGVASNQLELEIVPIGLPVRWLRFSSKTESTNEYLAAGYGSEGGLERRFILYRLADTSNIVDLAKDVARDGWDISPNGDRLAVGLSLGDVRLFSLPGGESCPETVLAVTQMEARRISCLRFDPQGKRLAAGSRECLFLYIWDLAEKKAEAYPHRNGVVDLDWHPGGNQLATACQNGDIYLIDLGSKITDRLFGTSSTLALPDVCFNRLGTVLAAVCSDLSLRLWRPQNRRQILMSFDLSIDPDKAQPAGLRFSSDDRRLGLNTKAGGVRQLQMLKVKGGSELLTFQGEAGTTEAFHSISFDPSGWLLMAAGPRGGIRSWGASDTHPLTNFGLGGPVSGVGFDRDGIALLASTTCGFFRLPFKPVSHSDGKELRLGPAECLLIRAGLGPFALTTNSTVAVVRAGRDVDTVLLFNPNDPSVESRWVAAECKLDEIAITPDGGWLFASATAQRKILVWDLSKPNGSKPCLSLPGSRYLSLSPSGKWLAAVTKREFQFWRVGSWKRSEFSIPRLQDIEEFAPIAFAPSPASAECLLAAATSPTMVELFRFIDQDLPTLEKLAKLESPDRLPVERLAIDPTFGRLAAASEGQILQVWNLAQIRAELHQRGLASGFPTFRPVPLGAVQLTNIIEPTDNSEEAKDAAVLQEARFTEIDTLTEQIEAAQIGKRQDIFPELRHRGQLYRELGHNKEALRDFKRALELRPGDTDVSNEIARVEEVLKSKREPSGPAAAAVGR